MDAARHRDQEAPTPLAAAQAAAPRGGLTTRHPYPPSPEVQARNDAHRAVLAQVDELATSPLHAYRAKVLLAARVPPPTVPTGQQVDDAVAATVPELDTTQLVAQQRADRRARRLRLVS